MGRLSCILGGSLLCAVACEGKPNTAETKTETKTEAIVGEALRGTKAEDAPPEVSNPALLRPFEADEKAPDEYRVELDTTKGKVVIAIHRAWAPNGADRFYNLVELGYYDDVAFFRAIEGFMVQFGIHGNPEVTKAWTMAPIKDDPRKKANEKGTVTFAAKRGKNTRTTHVFINYNDNTPLDSMGFAPFGEVVEGMDIVESLYTGYGEGAPKGKGPPQPKLEREGNPYLRERFPKLDYIRKAKVVE